MSNNLTVVSWNIAGMANLESVLKEVRLNKYNLICLLETWHTEKFEFDFLPGYRCIQSLAKKGTLGRPHGGILLFYDNKLINKIKILEINQYWIMIKLEKINKFFNRNIVISFVYFKPTADISLILDEMDLQLQGINEDFELMLIGDTNSRMADYQGNYEDVFSLCERRSKDTVVNASGKIFANWLDANNLIILNGRFKSDADGEYTFSNFNGNSVVDYMAASYDIYSIIKDFRIDNSCLSDHFPLVVKMFEDFINVDGNFIVSEAKIVWNPELSNNFKIKLDENINCALELYNENNETSYNNLIDILIETCKFNNMYKERNIIKPIGNYNKWFDKECLKYKKIMNKSLKKFRKDSSVENNRLYCQQRKLYRDKCGLKKRAFCNKILEELSRSRDSKTFWSIINGLKFRNKMMGNNIKDEEWVDFFTKYRIDDKTQIYKPVINYDWELDQLFSMNELKMAINMLKNNKAAGKDLIKAELIKNATEGFFCALLKVLNRIWTKSEIPTKMNSMITCPIFKSGNEDLVDNYRPITLISVITKIIINILYIRLRDWLEFHQRLHEAQTGYRRGYRTSDNVFVLNSIINLKISRKRGKVFALFIDLSKAFDSIGHNLLWNNLAKIGVSNKFIGFLAKYYENANTCIKKDRIIDSPILIKKGVLQGDSLSPVLFNIVMDSLPRTLDAMNINDIIMQGQCINCLLYADDIVVLAESPVNLQKKD